VIRHAGMAKAARAFDDALDGDPTFVMEGSGLIDCSIDEDACLVGNPTVRPREGSQNYDDACLHGQLPAAADLDFGALSQHHADLGNRVRAFLLMMRGRKICPAEARTMRGAPARAIQELAGHRDLATTQRYMHLSPAAVENAIRLLDALGHRPVVETFWRREMSSRRKVGARTS
jgi:hypothetical protein